MRKEYQQIGFTFVFIIGFLYLGKLLREFFIAQSLFEELPADLISGSIVRATILLVLIYLVYKWKLQRFNGLVKGNKPESWQVFLIPMIIISFAFFSNWAIYTNAGILLLTLFIISVTLVGFIEEIAFRGIIMPLFIKLFHKNKQVLYWSVLLPASLTTESHFEC